MDVDNIWRKGGNYKGNTRITLQGEKGKGKHGGKGYYKGFDKVTNKGTAKAKKKATEEHRHAASTHNGLLLQPTLGS